MNIERLKELRDNLHRIPVDRLDMVRYSTASDFSVNIAVNEHTCNTSCCLVGWTPHILSDAQPEPQEGWLHYRLRIYGTPASVDTPYFLFGFEWDDDIDHAKKRIQYVIDNGDAPPNWRDDPEWNCHCHTSTI